MAGASPHYSDLVREALDEKFPNTWIGWSGPIQRLSRVWEEAEYRLNICRATDGGHIEIDQMSYSPGEIIVFFW
jgi:hypothetical protein